MASGWLIAAGLAAGGVVLYLYEKSKKPPPSGSDCKAGCKALLTGDEEKACELACDAAGYIPDPFHDSAGDRNAAIQKGDQGNIQLNGAVKLGLPAELQLARSVNDPNGTNNGIEMMTGSVLEFESGCQPFSGAPGWSKCKTGTQSMWADETDPDDAYNHAALPAFANADLESVWLDHHDTGSPLDDATKAAAFSGNANEDHPDPTTQGPFPSGRTIGATKQAPGTKVPTGQVGYLVRGKPMMCPQGQAPDIWDESGLPRALGADEEIVCAVDGRHRAKEGTGGGVSTGEGTQAQHEQVGNVGGQIDCPPPPGFTWDTGPIGPYLRRLHAGETPKCKTGSSTPPSSSSSSSSSTSTRSAPSSTPFQALRLTPQGFG
jgi:hypothetical protein